MSVRTMSGSRFFIPATIFSYRLIYNSSTLPIEIAAFTDKILPHFPQVPFVKDAPSVIFNKDKFHLIGHGKAPARINSFVFDYYFRQYCEDLPGKEGYPELFRLYNFEMIGVANLERFQLEAFAAAESTDGVNWTNHYGGAELS